MIPSTRRIKYAGSSMANEWWKAYRRREGKERKSYELRVTNTQLQTLLLQILEPHLLCRFILAFNGLNMVRFPGGLIEQSRYDFIVPYITAR